VKNKNVKGCNPQTIFPWSNRWYILPGLRQACLPPILSKSTFRRRNTRRVFCWSEIWDQRKSWSVLAGRLQCIPVEIAVKQTIKAMKTTPHTSIKKRSHSGTGYRRNPPPISMEIRRVAGLTWNRLVRADNRTGKCASGVDKFGSVVDRF